MPSADDSVTVLTHAAFDEIGRTANDNPCRESLRPDTIASDLIPIENLLSCIGRRIGRPSGFESASASKAGIRLKSRIGNR
jgi:hypothetical protein